ncbi:MAG: hypothetical protein IKU98_03270 [Bacteroidaceae bacterium]|nr:hypothetical protein [Bacteroidaceae bacterium]
MKKNNQKKFLKSFVDSEKGRTFAAQMRNKAHEHRESGSRMARSSIG